MSFFDCAWRFKKGNKILCGCFDYEDNIDILLLTGAAKNEIELLDFELINLIDYKLLFTCEIIAEIFPVSECVSRPIYYLTDINNNKIDINVLIRE
ncbi:MAG: hypothetical protein LBV52_06230 [Spirochaetaceae bacterium]|nr:hypothetical protein [Spirochaetaceae bacterium]